MVTSTSRRCPTCHTYLEGAEAACPSCGGVFCPPHTEWPAGMKRLVALCTLIDATAMLRSEQERYERLLANAFKGRWYGSRHVPWSALPIDCYTVAARLLEEWERAGCPTDFPTLERLRARLAFDHAAA